MIKQYRGLGGIVDRELHNECFSRAGVLLVLLEVDGEVVPPRIITGHAEEEIVRLGGESDRLQGAQPGIRDRTRRQAGMLVGIIAGIHLQVVQ